MATIHQELVGGDRQLKKSDSKTRLLEFSSTTLDAQTLDLVKHVNKMVNNTALADRAKFAIEMEGFK